MLDIHKSLSMLVVRNMLGHATPSEVALLEEWASLSVENRNWLKRFDDYEYILSRIEFCKSIDQDACKEEFSRRLDAQMSKKTKVVQMWRWGYSSVAVLLLITFAAWMYKLWGRHSPESVAVAQKKSHDFIQKKGSLPAPPPRRLEAAPKRGIHHPQPQQQIAIPVIATSPPSNTTTPILTDSLKEFEVSNASNEGTVIEKTGPRLKSHQINNPHNVTLLDHMLPDNSIVSLNAVSSINYPGVFEGTKRRVELNGEGYFQVLQGDSMAFLVVANAVDIETFGGTFNVRSYGDDKLTEVTALAGNILVAAGPYSTTLKPGESAMVVKGRPIEKYTTKSIDKVIAWTKGEFFFDNDDPVIVAMEIARWYGLACCVTGKSNSKASFRGPRNKPSGDVISALKTTDNKPHFKIQGNELVVE